MNRPAQTQLAEVAYRGVPTGDVPATEVALALLERGRFWAKLATFVLTVAGGIALLGGLWVTLIFVINWGEPNFNIAPNALVGGAGYVYGSGALMLALLLYRFLAAAGRVHSLRRPEDLEQTMARLRLVWLWLTLYLLTALGYPFVVLATAVALGVWP